MENEILQQILTKLDSLEQGQVKTNQRLEGMQTDLNEVNQNQTRTEVLIENETNPSIKAIAEAYKDHTERLERIENTVDDLKVMVDAHTVIIKTTTKQ